jgi:long-chain acyl-CoA synthetase
MRLSEYLRAQALRGPDREAVVCGKERVSFAELDSSVDQLASGLHELGVRRGDRVAVCLPNGVDFVRCFLAVCRLGALTVPVNAQLTNSEIGFLLADSGPRVLVTPAGRWAALRSTGIDESTLVVTTGGADEQPGDGSHRLEQLRRTAARALPELPVDADDCSICYTSGTTGRPKGAVLTQSNYITAHGFLNAVMWRLGPSDRTLVTTPMAHRTGLARIVNMVCHGSCVVIMAKFEAREATRLIETEKVTVLGMVPTVGRMLIEAVEAQPHRFASLRTVLGTGEAFPPSLADRFEAALPGVRVHAFFAMTEVGQIAGLDPEDRAGHVGSVGRPVPGIEIRLVDRDGAVVPAGGTGEIQVRSGQPGQFLVMRGYYNLPDATEQVLRDGWLATGDLGRFDADGFLYIVDRKKDMVVTGGYNVYSREVEDVIRELAAVADVGVVGRPDAMYGESVAAFVELHPGRELSESDVIQHCQQRLAGYKKPRYIAFVRQLPRSPVGKVLKRELRALA